MIPQSFIQDLLSRLDIVSVVERYVPLRRAGANYVACCPFHNEKTPSFSVSPTKQFYHCFGCGAHGTAISFVMEYQGMGFVDAVKELAQSAGMTVPEERQETGRERERKAQVESLTEVMQRAARYYRDALKQSDVAIAYLKQRGLTGEIAARFGVGYAPEGWQNLETVFADYGSSKNLAEAGLVIDNEKGRRYDRFRDRIMFPILDQKGSVIGFGGRVLEKGEPKYLNSPETPLFEKGRELYGLFQARQAIRAAGRVLVVEGYMDVVALAQHGVGYAVATLGTATTPVHVQKLLRQADDVVFCFDGDAAGRKAAWRALENSLELVADDKRLSFLFLPQDEDPDSYIRRHGKDAFEASLGEAVPLSEFLLRELAARVDMRTEEGRAHFLQTAKPLLEKIPAPALGMLLRKRAAEMAGLEREEASGLLGLPKKAVPSGPQPSKRPSRAAPPPPARLLLELLLVRPGLLRQCPLDVPEARQGEVAALAAVVDYLAHGAEGASAAALHHRFVDTPHGPYLEAAARSSRWDGFSDEELVHEFSGAAEMLRREKLAGERSRTLEKLQQKNLRDLTPEERELYRQSLTLGGSAAQ